jgi:signal transduction histidine kinase
MGINMNKSKKPNYDNTAFAYCLKVLVFTVLGSAALLGGTIFVLSTFGTSKGAIEANMGILLIFMVNLEILCPFLLVRQLVKPLDVLNHASEKLAKGEFDVVLNYRGKIAELEALFQNFKTMSVELASVETLRSDFVSNVSHEFKTPLTSIEGYATLLQNTDLTTEEKNEYINRILSNTHRLSSLVGNILMLNKLENQTLQPEISTYRLDDQILQILLQQESLWNQKELEFDLDLSEIIYEGAEQMFYHVWSNLISNAIKYSNNCGVIKISLKKNGKQIIFKITDQGIGISQDNLRHIFEKFYQADTSHKKEGNGLGLAQVKKILDLSGNKIIVESAEGNGSTFTVYLLC